MAKAKAPPAEEQGYLPGMAPKRNKVIHPKAERYADLRDSRMEAGREEKEAKQNLIEAMLKEGLEVYEYNGIRVDLTEKREIKVKVNGQEPAEKSEDE